MSEAFSPLINYRGAALKAGLPRFNEFNDKYTEMTLENVRQYQAERWELLRGWHGCNPPATVDVCTYHYQNGDYTGEGLVYRPRRGPSPGALPLALYVHGGGSTLCKELYAYECSTFAQEGNCVVFNVEYRMMPEDHYPTAQEDCYAALCAAVSQAADFGADPGRIAIMGDSAGGNLCAALTLMAKDRQFPKIGLQVLLYPLTDRRVMATLPGRNRPSGSAKSINEDEIVLPYASPIFGDLRDLPPCLLITGSCDFLFEDNLRYARKLLAAGNEIDLQIYEGMPHGFLQMVNEPATDCIRTICESLRENLC